MSETPAATQTVTWSPSAGSMGTYGYYGTRGPVRMFSLHWRSGERPWVLTCRLPGYDSKQWYKATDTEAHQLAERILRKWLVAIGAHLDENSGG